MNKVLAAMATVCMGIALTGCSMFVPSPVAPSPTLSIKPSPMLSVAPSPVWDFRIFEETPPPTAVMPPEPKTQEAAASTSSTVIATMDAVEKRLAGIKIGLDPGHQDKHNHELEPNAPGSKTMKHKVSSGTQGAVSKVPEYEVNLKIGLYLRDMLESEGATVVMTRTTNDVDLSNVQRAELMNESDVALCVRLHCNGGSPSVHGAFILTPSGKYCKDIKKTSSEAASVVLRHFIIATGAKNLGLTPRDDQTGFNWSKVPIINIEMGHMTNKNEEANLIDNEYQRLCAKGIFNGLVAYFTDESTIENEPQSDASTTQEE